MYHRYRPSSFISNVAVSTQTYTFTARVVAYLPRLHCSVGRIVFLGRSAESLALANSAKLEGPDEICWSVLY